MIAFNSWNKVKREARARVIISKIGNSGNAADAECLQCWYVNELNSVPNARKHSWGTQVPSKHKQRNFSCQLKSNWWLQKRNSSRNDRNCWLQNEPREKWNKSMEPKRKWMKWSLRIRKSARKPKKACSKCVVPWREPMGGVSPRVFPDYARDWDSMKPELQLKVPGGKTHDCIHSPMWRFQVLKIWT